MAGPFDFLHLKSHTEGSSNELTFDVLEATSRGINQKKEKKERVSAGPKAVQGSFHGASGSSTFSDVDEVTRRKRARRARSIRLRLVAVVAVVALVATGVFFGYRFHQDQQDFSARFHQIIDRFIEIDRTMVEVDSLMDDPLNSLELVERAEVAERFASLNRELNAVSAAAQEMEAAAQTDRDRAALREVTNAAAARSDMIDAAESAFTLSERANQLADSAAAAWSDVLAADGLAREAAELSNKATTEAATNDARDKTQQARSLMDSARSVLVQVAKEQPGVDLSAEKAYIDKRIESLDAALKTTDALLAGNRDAARAANNEYNSTDAEAAALADSMQGTPPEHVKDAFRSTLDENLGAYSQARSTVIAADSSLRAYL